MRRCTIAEKKPRELIKVEPLRALSPFGELERLWSKEFLKEPFCLLPSSIWKTFGLPEWEEVVFLRTASMRLDPMDMHFTLQLHKRPRVNRSSRLRTAIGLTC
jgi:hypothetical protein